MENLKHTKEYAIKLATIHQQEKGGYASDFFSGYMKAIEESGSPDLLEALIEMYKSCKPQKFGVDLFETDLTSVGSITMPSEQAVLKMCNAINKATK